MLPITIITDFGYSDHYAGAMKLKILQIFPEAKIVDITHGVKRHNVRHASYVLNAIYRIGMKAVHLVVVDPGVGSGRECLAIKLKNGYAVLPNNGIISPLRDEIIEIYEIPVPPDASATFHGRDVFAPTAAKIAKGVKPEKFCTKFPKEKLILFNQPLLSGEKIVGEIFHIDHFGNVITNIPAEMVFFKIGDEIQVKIGNKIFQARMVKSYSEGRKNEIIALINSENFLEFSINMGSAAKILRVKEGSVVEVCSA